MPGPSVRPAAFTLDDSTSSANVAVIGQTVYTSLFPNGQSPIGQSIQIRKVPFTVIGLLTAKGGNADDVLMIPFTTGQVRLFGSTSINEIVLQVGDAAQIPTVTTDITTLLRQLHRLSASQPADFSIQSNNDVISRVSGVTSTLTTLLGGVAAVSLVVGGIGIMNIMLVSVTERTHEIGIRLAIGGQPSDVMSQFLIEAVMLSVLGGLIGILLGSGVALALPYVAGWTTVFTVAGHPARVRCVGHHRHVLRDLSGAQGVIARSDYRAPLRIDSARNEETTRMIVHSRVFHRAALALAILFAVLSPGAALAQSDPRSFSDTGFTISDDAIWSFFTQYGGTSTFGEPISREFVLIGTPAQLFQNAALQVQPDGSVKAMQLTDPGLMPYTSLAGMTVPAANPATAYVAPTPDQPNYMARLLVYVQAIVREPFLSTYSGSGGSVVWACRRPLQLQTRTIRISCISGSRTASCSMTRPRAQLRRCRSASISRSC
jgi:hypothetical protein